MRQLPLITLVAWFLFDFFIAPRLNMEQVSVFVWRHGWKAQALMVTWLLLLVSHIAFMWPWGPAG